MMQESHVTSMTRQLMSTIDAFNDRQAALLVGTATFVCLWYSLSAVWHLLYKNPVPIVGYRHSWEPGWFVGLRFARGSSGILREGYKNFKNGMFRIRRNDSEVLIVPRKYIEELRDVKETRLSAMEAHLKNMVGHCTIGNVDLMRHGLHRRVLQQKMTPSLGILVPPLKDEIEFSLRTEVPKCEDWTDVQLHQLSVRIVTRISARIFVGLPLCRNQEWLDNTVLYTKNLGLTRNLLRLFPSPMRSFAALVMPSWWRLRANLTTANRLITPIILERQANSDSIPAANKPNDFLQWIIDAASPEESHPHHLSHRQLLITLAAIHTTSTQTAQAIYDLCSHPHYFEPLRQEIITVLQEDRGFKKTTLNKLRRLDSFLKESQRTNPPLLMSFQRIVVGSPITLKDGTKLGIGTHLGVASDAIMHDPEILPGGGDPDVFDPFRYSRLREDPSKPENLNRYQFAMTDASSLHFGHGVSACPGRFFASNEIKMLLCHLIMCYDFKYSDGEGRPRNFSYEEAIYPDPQARVLIRRRAIPEQYLSDILAC